MPKVAKVSKVACVYNVYSISHFVCQTNSTVKFLLLAFRGARLVNIDCYSTILHSLTCTRYSVFI